MITLKPFQKNKAKKLSIKILKAINEHVDGHENIFLMYSPNLGKSFIIISTIAKTIENENLLDEKKSVWIWVTKHHPIKHHFRSTHIEYSLIQHKIFCSSNQKITKLVDHTVYLFDIEKQNNWKKLVDQSNFKKTEQNIILILDLNYRKNNILKKNKNKIVRLIERTSPNVILNVIQQDWNQSKFNINIIDKSKNFKEIEKNDIKEHHRLIIDKKNNVWENSSELMRSETVVVDKNNLLNDNPINISLINKKFHSFHINRFLITEGVRRLNDLKKKYQEISSQINPLMIVAFPNEKINYQDEIIDLLKKKHKNKKINYIGNDLVENSNVQIDPIFKIFKHHPIDCIITNEKRLKLWDCAKAQVIVYISQTPLNKNKNFLEQQNIAKLISEPTKGFYKNEDLNKAYYYFWHPDIEKWHLSDKEYQDYLDSQILNNEPQRKKKYNASFIRLIFSLFLGFCQLLVFIAVLNNWWEY